MAPNNQRPYLRLQRRERVSQQTTIFVLAFVLTFGVLLLGVGGIMIYNAYMKQVDRRQNHDISNRRTRTRNQTIAQPGNRARGIELRNIASNGNVDRQSGQRNHATKTYHDSLHEPIPRPGPNAKSNRRPDRLSQEKAKINMSRNHRLGASVPTARTQRHRLSPEYPAAAYMKERNIVPRWRDPNSNVPPMPPPSPITTPIENAPTEPPAPWDIDMPSSTHNAFSDSLPPLPPSSASLGSVSSTSNAAPAEEPEWTPYTPPMEGSGSTPQTPPMKGSGWNSRTPPMGESGYESELISSFHSENVHGD